MIMSDINKHMQNKCYFNNTKFLMLRLLELVRLEWERAFHELLIKPKNVEILFFNIGSHHNLIYQWTVRSAGSLVVDSVFSVQEEKLQSLK